MAYAKDFIKIDIMGDCYGETEIWNTGLKLRLNSSFTITEGKLEDAAKHVANQWENFFKLNDTIYGYSFSNAYRTKEVKASQVGVNGKVIGNTYTHFYPAPIVGAGGGSYPAPQTSVAASFRSDKQRGPGSQGRMYLPGIAYSIDNRGLMPNDRVRRLANEFNNFINNVNNTATGPLDGFKVVLASSVGEGIELDVTKTGIDRKVDTQRRRANNMKSDYLTNEVG